MGYRNFASLLRVPGAYTAAVQFADGVESKKHQRKFVKDKGMKMVLVNHHDEDLKLK